VINLDIWKKAKSVVKRFFCKAPVAGVVVVAGVSAVVSTSVCSTAYAQLDLTGVAVDTAPVFTIAVIVITALAAIWAISKTIGLIRSR
jgi:hypothetical protein